MGYYMAGDYYRGQGDFFPGFGAVARVAGAVGKALVKRIAPKLPTIGRVATGIGVVGTIAPLMPRTLPNMPFMPRGGQGFTGGAAYSRPWPTDKQGRPRRARKDGRPYGVPTLNPANPKALRRAIRREKGFIALARRALAGTGITIGRRPSFAAKKKR